MPGPSYSSRIKGEKPKIIVGLEKKMVIKHLAATSYIKVMK